MLNYAWRSLLVCLQSSASRVSADDLRDTGTECKAHTCPQNPTPHDLSRQGNGQPTRQPRQVTARITEDGPPSSKGVLNVVAMLEQRPYIVLPS